MKFPKLNRRRFLFGACLGAPLMVLAEAKWLEPSWLATRHVRISKGSPTHRVVHFTDLHYKGDRAFAESVVRRINALKPDAVCFTGDIIEDAEYLPAALEILSGITAPMFGVPGNHDYWSKVPFDGIARCFAATGGGWLLDRAMPAAGGAINVIGTACMNASQVPPAPLAGKKNILLMHYPAWVKNLGNQKYDLMLAGHSHGGQVRLPFLGALVLPFGVDQYDLGYFVTSAGPLYVNAGIGWFTWPLRFNCRPELTVFEI